MSNSLAEVHPELVSEWSEKNLPLKPDEVNAKARKNVLWRCSKCGNEWKSVINISHLPTRMLLSNLMKQTL